MICEPRPRARRPRRTAHAAAATSAPAPAPSVVSAFRRADNTICHGRCGQPMSLQGIRGLLEADFYCYACLAHVTLPLVVLDGLPVTAPVVASR